MKIVLDTNVFVSGVFFSGPPRRLLDACRQGKLKVVLSLDILSEYQRIGIDLAMHHPGIGLEPMLEFLLTGADLISPKPLGEPVCSHANDDMFLACALSARTSIIVIGDRHLLAVSGYRGVSVMKPRAFVDEYLS